jgi:hypothetical protein
MDDRSAARYDKFVRVLNFGRANQADVATTDAPQHLDKLDAVIKGLDKAKAGQKGGSAEAKDVLIDALRIDVANITRTASTIGQDEAGFEKNYRPPAAPNPAAIVTAADAIIAQLVELPTDDNATKAAKTARRAKFTAKGLPADFAANLATDRGAIDSAKTTEDNSDSEGVKNTALVGKLVADGMKECNYLDAIFHNVYTRNPEKTRAWMSESHLERAPERKKKPAPPPPQ